MSPQFLSTATDLFVAITKGGVETMLLRTVMRKNKSCGILVLVSKKCMEEKRIKNDFGVEKMERLVRWMDRRGGGGGCIVIDSSDIGRGDPGYVTCEQK